jgi:hypothetical protein
MEPLAALSPRASRCPAKPNTDGVATTLERTTPEFHGGHRCRRATPEDLSAEPRPDFSGFVVGETTRQGKKPRGARRWGARPGGSGAATMEANRP